MDPKKRMLRCRICPSCRGIAVQTMCLQGCEIVCVRCQRGTGVFNDWDEVYIQKEAHDKLREVYEPDIHKMAFEYGEAGCCDCRKQGGNNCETCNIDYEYQFYVKEDE